MDSTKSLREFSLDSFKKASSGMVAKNDATVRSYDDFFGRACFHSYTKKEIEDILNNGSILEQQRMSKAFFDKEGQYKQFILYYANLLKYSGLLIPNPAYGKKLSTDHIQKRYFQAMEFVEGLKLNAILPEIALKVFRDGCYYGVLSKVDKKGATILDLPFSYCRSLYKDDMGNDVIEFNLTYFDQFFDKKTRQAALKTYPKFISSSYNKYHNGRLKTSWVILPDDIAICFPFLDGRPPFLNVITALKEYKEAVQLELRREANQIKKIVVQKIPYNPQMNQFVFIPEEAEEIHKGTVDMLRNDESTEVLTTFADVEIADSKTVADGAQENLKRMAQHVNQEIGLTNQLFSATDSTTTDNSLREDLSIVMLLANKISVFLTKLINNQFANSNITFKYSIMPISWQNEDAYLDKSFKLVNNGYSLLLPALSLNLSQRDLIGLKELENDVLKLDEKLLPPQLSYTQAGNEKELEKDEKDDEKEKGKEKRGIKDDGSEAENNGRPALKEDEKKESTIERQQQIEKSGGK